MHDVGNLRAGETNIILGFVETTDSEQPAQDYAYSFQGREQVFMYETPQRVKTGSDGLVPALVSL